MIKISVRNISTDLQEIKLSANNIEIDLGLCDDKERLQLALCLLDTVDDLFPDDEDVYDNLQDVCRTLYEKYNC